MGSFFLEITQTKKRQNEVGAHKNFCSQPSFCNEESEGAKGLEALQFVLLFLTL